MSRGQEELQLSSPQPDMQYPYNEGGTEYPSHEKGRCPVPY